MDVIFTQLSRVFGNQGSHYLWYIAIIVVLFTMVMVFIVVKSRSGDFTAEIGKLKNIADNHNELMKQHQLREKELEDQLQEKEAMIANYERKLAQLEQKK